MPDGDTKASHEPPGLSYPPPYTTDPLLRLFTPTEVFSKLASADPGGDKGSNLGATGFLQECFHFVFSFHEKAINK